MNIFFIIAVCVIILGQWHLSRQLEGLGRGLKLVDTALDTILAAEEIR
jgi:hypothetical protein